MHVIAICKGACAQCTPQCSTRVQRRIIHEAGVPPPPPPPPLRCPSPPPPLPPLPAACRPGRALTTTLPHSLLPAPACAAGMQPQRASAPDWPFKAQGTQLIGAISSIDFCSAAPHDYLVSAGTRLQLYNGANSVAKRQFTRFKDRAYGGSFRRDGRLIVAGCEDSVVQVGPLAGGGGAMAVPGCCGCCFTLYCTAYQPCSAACWSLSQRCLLGCLSLAGS